MFKNSCKKFDCLKYGQFNLVHQCKYGIGDQIDSLLNRVSNEQSLWFGILDPIAILLKRAHQYSVILEDAGDNTICDGHALYQTRAEQIMSATY